ncbi:MAG: ATP-dependent Clp protease ATP-binding subunit [Firmicutes bacterium]|nr:ATP-dependent Clp protease ATP-binding subunit [Bacillota bacterium]
MRNFSAKAELAIKKAIEAAQLLHAKYVGTEHLLLGILRGDKHSIAYEVLLREKCFDTTVLNNIMSDISGKDARKELTEKDFSPKLNKALDFAWEECLRNERSEISTDYLLLALLISDRDNIALKVLNDLKINTNKLVDDLDYIINMHDRKEHENPAPVFHEDDGMMMPQQQESMIEAYCRNLNDWAKNGRLDPVIGREKELETIIRILTRRTKNNPVLIGDPGVGKTAVAEGLAQQIADGNVPEMLKNKLVYSIDMPAMVAGTKYRGEFEERMKNLLEELRERTEVILFIDEIHSILNAGGAEGSINASNMLKPALSRNELQVIGATTIKEYRKFVEKDAAFERRFQPVEIEEPSQDEAIEMLLKLKPHYEKHHRLEITDAAAEAAVRLSARYMTDRFLPDKAIDMLDEAAAMVGIRNSGKRTGNETIEYKIKDIEEQTEEMLAEGDFAKVKKLYAKEQKLRAKLEESGTDGAVLKNVKVTAEDVAAVISSHTGIPVKQMQTDEIKRLKNMEKELHKRVIGQEEAVNAVSRAIRRGRVGLKSPKRPIGSFLFLGPTGVGKTELSKAVTEVLFGSEDAMIRVDMSEYMEKHSVSRFIGSPPGYVGFEEGGQLAEKIRRKPYSVVLFDEIEKAHPDVFNILLQILDDGFITDAQGRKIDFKNTVIIMTSNAGARNISAPKRLGFISGDTAEKDYQSMRSGVLTDIKEIFRPEFLNRIDETIVFRPLSKDEITGIAKLLLNEVKQRMKAANIDIAFDKKAVDKIAEQGFDTVYGARPLRRAIQNNIEDKLAEAMLNGDIQAGDKVKMTYTDDFKIKK